MNSFGQKVKALREERHLTQDELAIKAGVSRSFVQSLERSNTPPKTRSGNLTAVLRALDATVESVTAGSRAQDGFIFAANDTADEPVYHGVSAARIDTRDAVEIDRVSAGPRGDTFRVIIDGRCMEPDYPHGTQVRFDRTAMESDGLVASQDYILFLNNGESTFKQVVFSGQDKTRVILRCRNPDKKHFPDRTLSLKEIRSAARVIERIFPPPTP